MDSDLLPCRKWRILIVVFGELTPHCDWSFQSGRVQDRWVWLVRLTVMTDYGASVDSTKQEQRNPKCMFLRKSIQNYPKHKHHRTNIPSHLNVPTSSTHLILNVKMRTNFNVTEALKGMRMEIILLYTPLFAYMHTSWAASFFFSCFYFFDHFVSVRNRYLTKSSFSMAVLFEIEVGRLFFPFTCLSLIWFNWLFVHLRQSQRSNFLIGWRNWTSRLQYFEVTKYDSIMRRKHETAFALVVEQKEKQVLDIYSFLSNLLWNDTNHKTLWLKGSSVNMGEHGLNFQICFEQESTDWNFKFVLKVFCFGGQFLTHRYNAWNVQTFNTKYVMCDDVKGFLHTRAFNECLKYCSFCLWYCKQWFAEYCRAARVVNVIPVKREKFGFSWCVLGLVSLTASDLLNNKVSYVLDLTSLASKISVDIGGTIEHLPTVLFGCFGEYHGQKYASLLWIYPLKKIRIAEPIESGLSESACQCKFARRDCSGPRMGC